MIEFGPGDALAAAGWPGRPAADALLLAPDHPFLRHGHRRGFADGQAEELTDSIVASVDPRQGTVAGPVGCLGFVALAPAEQGGDPVTPAARRVLSAAMDWLRNAGVAVIRAPVQLSTWYGHRAITGGFPDEGGLPAFPLEPRGDRRLLALLEDGGFTPAHRAVSCLVDPRAVVAQAEPALARVARRGVRDRPIDLEDLDAELARLHRLSGVIFEGAWGLSGIDLEEFLCLYRPLAGLVDPALVRIFEDAGRRPIGFALGLGMPTGSGPVPGGGRAFVLKTIGVTGEARSHYPGIGVAVTAMLHSAAQEHGYVAGVHALMASGSMANRLSLRWGREIRTYATFERGAT